MADLLAFDLPAGFLDFGGAITEEFEDVDGVLLWGIHSAN